MFRFLFLLGLSSVSWASTICLNMIVKDEEAVIERCLQSVKPYIDTWVIVDTGSSDHTMELIEKELKGIPGELHQKPWVGFDVNRTEALALAHKKADYILFIDADEVLNVENTQWKEGLNLDFYIANIRADKLSSTRFFLIKGDKETCWEGVMHEKLKVEPNWHWQEIGGIWVDASADDGARSKDPDKYLKDAQRIEEGLKKDPTNQRLARYLAQTLYSVKAYEKTIEAAQYRLSLGGWEEEMYYCYFLIAASKQALKAPFEEVAKCYETAIQYRPHRAESYFYFATYLAEQKEFERSYQVAQKALHLPFPTRETVNLLPWVYHWGLKLLFADLATMKNEHAIAAHYYALALQHSQEMPYETLALTQNALTRCQQHVSSLPQ